MEDFMSSRSFGESWVQYILEFNMPDVADEKKVKYEIIQMLEPVINTAARSNLKRNDIRLFLWGYDNIWQSFFIYSRKGSYNPKLIQLKKCLREGYALMLYRSVEMGQMRMIFEPKQSVFQKVFSSSDKARSFFRRKTEPKEKEVYE